MLSKFFIYRPKFALVISLAMTLMGLIALKVLPVSEYPQISPTVITVSTMYPGASADVVKKTVAQPVEAKVNGVEDMIYVSTFVLAQMAIWRRFESTTLSLKRLPLCHKKLTKSVLLFARSLPTCLALSLCVHQSRHTTVSTFPTTLT